MSQFSHSLGGKRLDKKSETTYAMKLINKTIDERVTPKKANSVHKSSTPRSTGSKTAKLTNVQEHPYTETPGTRKAQHDNLPSPMQEGARIYDPIFARLNKPVSVFEGHRNSELVTKWDQGHTSFKTVNYD